MIITEQFITRLRTPKGGWTRDVLAILGVPWPPPTGWKATLIGTKLPAEKVQRLEAIIAKQNASDGETGNLFG